MPLSWTFGIINDLKNFSMNKMRFDYGNKHNGATAHENKQSAYAKTKNKDADQS